MRVDLGLPHPGVISIQQRVVEAQVQRRRLGLRLFAHQRQHGLQRRDDGGKIVATTRLAPDHFARRIGVAERRHQIARHRRCVTPYPLHFI